MAHIILCAEGGKPLKSGNACNESGHKSMTAIFIATFCFVFLKAFQQVNVVDGHYKLVVPVSFGMALCEVLIVLNVVKAATVWAALPMGLAGALGACGAMWAHRRYVK